jgi:hypothetical protein
MKKSLPIIIALVVIVVALTGWKFLSQNKETSTKDENGQTPTTQEEIQEEGFTGKIKDAFMRNVPLKCTYEMDENNSGVGWLKDQKYYGEITTNGKLGYIILADNCMWTWTKGETQGVKMCFETEEGEDIWNDIEEGQQAAGYDYRCAPSLVNDAVFTPPSDINFMDLDQMMQGFQQPDQTGEGE